MGSTPTDAVKGSTLEGRKKHGGRELVELAATVD
jgi:hypothetical protein